MRHDVVQLRDVSAPTCGRSGSQWLTLEAARLVGVDTSYVTDGIGPRERGMVYRSGYWGHVSTVHDVFVEVMPPDGVTYSSPRAVYWEVAEQSGSDVRVRRHCTSWSYDRGNQPLFTLTG
jgi:hypothetical protein